MKEYTMYLTQEELDVLFHTIGELHAKFGNLNTSNTKHNILSKRYGYMKASFFENDISIIEELPAISLP